MGLLTEVFTADDDARAAAVLGTGPAAAGRRVVDTGGIEPYVQFGTLEEILTARPYEQIAAAQPDPVALLDGGEAFVARLTDDLVTALADLPGDRIDEVAAAWAATEEFGGVTDPEVLADLLRELHQLTRSRGTDTVYCWLSL